MKGEVMYKIYVKCDEYNRILDVNSSAFLDDLTDWTQIDEGDGFRYKHAQNHYLGKPLYTEQVIPRYKLDAGQVVERTADEIQVDVDALPPPPPNPEEQLRQMQEVLNALLGGQ